MALYVGTSGFSYAAWKGSFYPEHLPGQDMLAFYGTRFNGVEINNTFHRMPKPSLLEGWRGEVPAGFRFALKAPQSITHVRRLREVDDAVSYFFDVAGVLGERLGAVLFQIPPGLKKDVPLLHDFLSLVPPGARVALQFRNRSWLDDDVFSLMQRNDAALCLVDSEDDEAMPAVATAGWGYLRLRRPEYGSAELGKWVDLVNRQGWRDTFVFFKHEDAAKGPLFARQFLDIVAGG